MEQIQPLSAKHSLGYLIVTELMYLGTVKADEYFIHKIRNRITILESSHLGGLTLGFYPRT